MYVGWPDGCHGPHVEGVAGAWLLGKELETGMVVGSEGGEREYACAILGEDLHRALVDEDAQPQLSVAGRHTGMTGVLELGHLEVGNLGTVDDERVAVDVVGNDELAPASHTEVHSEGAAESGIEGHLCLVDIGEQGDVLDGGAPCLQAAGIMLAGAAQGGEVTLWALHEAPSVGGVAERQLTGNGPEAFAVGHGQVAAVAPVGHPAHGVDTAAEGVVEVLEGARGIEVGTAVDIDACLLLESLGMEGAPVEVTDEILLVVPVDGDDEHPFLLSCLRPVVDLELEEVGALETAVGAPGRTEVAEPRPLFQVGRDVEGNLALEGLADDHEPLAAVFEPDDGGVAEVLVADVEHGVAVVVGERASVVVADGESLRLVLASRIVEGETGDIGIAAEAGGILRVGDDAACPAAQSPRHIAVDMAAHLVEVDEVGRLGTAPPIAVVLALVVEVSAGVADPSAAGAEMVLVAVVLVVGGLVGLREGDWLRKTF